LEVDTEINDEKLNDRKDIKIILGLAITLLGVAAYLT
jgi:hypothetical protein